ncbi:malignant T-cell-amplified sequence 1 isoform 1-T1 [Trichechus inunguis]|uniref:Malignant T-cell-amplified sequence 1 isoform X1 n=1 Tax=Trichechus manatus latirostris TaxID=127582 RepID=A0A2Y9R3E8_TRIMA|nr:malignant T-cell-amplified sequence 1 isoform X1 [Trichechus manatus latirostris]
MFKKFDEKENVSNCIQLKTSVIKGIKNQLIEQFPGIEPWLNQIMPKKDPVKIVRCHEHIEILTVNGELLFFRQREGPFYPTLRLLHKYPFILPHQQVDKGAIKFVLSGANIMCPGLTSPGAKLYPAAVDTIVVSFPGKGIVSLQKNIYIVFMPFPKALRYTFSETVLVSCCLVDCDSGQPHVCTGLLLLFSHAFLVTYEEMGSNFFFILETKLYPILGNFLEVK